MDTHQPRGLAYIPAERGPTGVANTHEVLCNQILASKADATVALTTLEILGTENITAPWRWRLCRPTLMEEQVYVPTARGVLQRHSLKFTHTHTKRVRMVQGEGTGVTSLASPKERSRHSVHSNKMSDSAVQGPETGKCVPAWSHGIRLCPVSVYRSGCPLG